MRLFLFVSLCVSSVWVGASPLHNLPQPSDDQWAWLQQESPAGKRVAVALTTHIDSANHGVWQQRGDQRIWQITLRAEGAKSLGFQIDGLGWSEETQLVLRDSQGLRRQQLLASDLLGKRLWTAQFPAESVALELIMPATEAAELRINTAYYGARPLQPKHGTCNIDVVCPDNEDAADQIDSTVLLQYAVPRGLSVCSGFVVNNMRQDRAPYILTADHCQINRSAQDSVRVYWQFQDEQCGNANGHVEGDPEDFPSSGGVEVLAEGQDSDFTLLVLGSAENPRAIPSSFAPYWSGWNAADAPATSGFGVHHPNGDEKSISRFSQTLQAVRESIDGRQTDSWLVFWETGTTQPGSSGSALWNAQGQAVGVLSGGDASCRTPDAPDLYGRFNRAWEEGSNCDRQLKYWLDPDDSGALSMDGAGLGNSTRPRIPACERTPVASGSGSGPLSPLLLLLLLIGWGITSSNRRVRL